LTREFVRLLAAFAVLAAFAGLAHAADVATTPRVEARLVADTTGVPASGGTISLALHQTMQPEWHTYWINPGESGEPTHIAWSLPEGFSAGDIRWPYPTRIPFGELANYGYSHEVLLRTEIAVPPGLREGQNVTFTADATWLVCKDICIPEKATLDLTLPVVAQPAANEAWREAFAEARAREPSKEAPFDANFAARGDEVTFYFRPLGGESGKGAQFFPLMKGLIKASAPQSSESRDGGFAIAVPAGWRMRDAERRKSIETIDGVLVVAEGGTAQAFEIRAVRGDIPAGATKVAAADLPLAEAILFAILGGLILNLMPCVFPILSMKALALVQAGHAERPWTDGVAYLLGVLTTFAGLGGALLWLRALGEDVGWGFQLQSPLSVAVLAYVLVLVGLNLSGVFQVGGTVQGAGQGLAGRGGLIGAFFTGVLAVVVAAPCTAPFMGAAMGFAFTQNAAITIAIFLALGFGLALPWVVVSFSPALIRLLPRPGPWMERFKQFLAFPMYAAAAWLVWVLSQQVTPEGLARVMFGLIVLALAAWAFGVVQARAARSQSSVLAGVVFLLALGSAVALVALPFTGRSGDNAPGETGALAAEPYSAARLADLRGQGRAVFVNLTAAWCVSCLYNERVALSTPAVADAFKSTGAVYVVGDWTNQNPEISALLKQHGREGVPLYLFFPPGGGEPKVLPQILTESLILDTLGVTR
jgi:thiol:disulfide interchange protein/DsbC/DsbD-like thiol-disulfide interchange protein